MKGLGVPLNDRKAFSWYRKAAQQGVPEAQDGVGYLYETGRGVAKDMQEAVRWYRLAAEQGFENARKNLARLHESVPNAAHRAVAAESAASDSSPVTREEMRAMMEEAAKRAVESQKIPTSPAIRSDVDAPSYQGIADPSRFALVIGIEKYENLPSADFAERDAKAVRAHLLALGYLERNVILLTGAQATKTGIEKYIESWLPRNIRDSSKVFIYFSGHGAPDPGSHQAYLAPWDADAKFLETTGYPIKRLYEKLNALKARQVLVAMDSCFSGSGGRSVLAKGARPLVNSVDMGNAEIGKVVVLAAAGPDEITGTAEGQEHGLFTYYLLKRLNERKGRAAVKDLFDWVVPQVQDAARRDNRDQTPRLLGSAAAEIGEAK